MTIFFLSYEHDPVVQSGMGGFRKIWELAAQCRTLGHRVVLFVPAGTRLREFPSLEAVEIPYLDLPVIRPLLIYLLLFAVPLLRAVRVSPDIIYMRTMHSPLSILLAKVMRAPLVIEVNGDSYAYYRAQRASGIRLGMIKLIDWANFRYCDRIIPISMGLQDMLWQRYLVPPEKTVLIESATDPELFRPMDSAVCRQRLGLDPAGRYVGFVGSFFRHQGIDVLIDAAPAIVRRFPDVRFLLVGDGVMRRTWAERISKRGLSASFLFTGQVPYPGVPLYIGATELCVAPFLADRGDASPLKLFDYLACGRPVVASAIPPLRDLLSRAEGIAPVPPEDPEALGKEIVRLLEDQEAARRLGENGRRWVLEAHSWQAAAKRLLRVCEEVLQERRR
ncbi:MAG: glycosyltransferase family 4 protein [candidate division NC10 bacterium]|nr:glycosyltransferase family 4 protein [candidate division NC10 bacterium]